MLLPMYIFLSCCMCSTVKVREYHTALHSEEQEPSACSKDSQLPDASCSNIRVLTTSLVTT